VLRNYENPFQNLEYTGIDLARVLEMEIRLKEDALRECENMEGSMLLHEETESGGMLATYTAVDNVNTTFEVYNYIKSLGFPIDFHRIPITDERSPKPGDFNNIIETLAKYPQKDTHFIYNCQLGRGRTTTGLVVTCIYMAQFNQQWLHSSTSQFLSVSIRDKLAAPSSTTMLLRGDYKIVKNLLRLLEKGPESKNHIDIIIDRCSHIQNLREAVHDFKVKFENAATDKARKTHLDRGLNYLSRYFFLIVFQGFILDTKKAHMKFPEWLEKRPEITSLIDSIESSFLPNA